MVFEATRRARPSLVRGPVDAPPCKWHLPLRLYAGRWHFDPVRVLAPQRRPCHRCPNLVERPTVLPFVKVIITPYKEFYYIGFLLSKRGLGYLVEWRSYMIHIKDQRGSLTPMANVIADETVLSLKLPTAVKPVQFVSNVHRN